MATRPRTAVAIAALALLALTGCQPDGPTVEPEPSSTVPPVFASDEEALAAAEEAYGKYLAVSSSISNDGGRQPERIVGFVSKDLEEQAIESSQELLDSGTRTRGSFTFDSSELQQYDDFGDGNAEITFYVCTDVTAIRVLSADGTDITPDDRQNRLPLEIVFKVTGTTNDFVLTSTELWSGDDFCAN